MSVEFKDSETKGNLMRAFAGESQARNRYTFSESKRRRISTNRCSIPYDSRD